MLRSPYTTETPIFVSAKLESLISLMEIDDDPEIADLSISRPHDGSIPLAPLLEWLATNRPGLLVKAQQESARIKDQGRM